MSIFRNLLFRDKVIPNNVILYTSYNNQIITPLTDAFNANIISNTYENGVGIITFDADVTAMSEWAFSYYESLTSITLPNSVTSISYNAFYNCSSLASITIPDGVTSIDRQAFYGCSNLAEFNGMLATKDKRCIVIDGKLSAFAPSGLTSYNIPNSVTSIDDKVFWLCTSLASVTIPNSVTSIGNYAFQDCTSLTSIIIPGSITSIGEGAFMSCLSLTSVSFGNGVTSTGDYTFSNCPKLTEITIPESVTSIGYEAFDGCSSLTSVYCKATTPPVGNSDMFVTNASGRKIYVPMSSVEVYKSAKYWKNYADAIEGYNF